MSNMVKALQAQLEEVDFAVRMLNQEVEDEQNAGDFEAPVAYAKKDRVLELRKKIKIALSDLGSPAL